MPLADQGALLQTAASLLWLPQAWWIACSVQVLADGGGVHGVIFLAAGVLAAGAARACLDAAGSLRSQLVARGLLSRLRGEVLEALKKASPLDGGQATSGQAASAMAEQAQAIVPWLSRYRTAMLRTRVVPLAVVCAVAYFSWVCALILLVAAPLIPLFMAIIGWRARAASEAQMVELGDMNSFLLDRLRGLSTLRALGAVDATAHRLRSHADGLRERTMKVLRIAFLSSAVLELFSALGVAMVAVYVGFHLLGTLAFGAWGGQLTLASAMFILLLAPSFFEPLRELSAVWHDRAAGEAASQALQALARQGLRVVGHGGGESLFGGDGDGVARPLSVDLVDLQVNVPGHASAMERIDVRIRAGEHVALWAPSGSGKSVLLSQIAGLIPVERGCIRIDGEELSPGNADALRARMAWMGQRVHVFAGSIARNVSLDRHGVSRRDMLNAARAAVFDDALLERSSASVGEGGKGLSGGETVRLGLARMAVQVQAGLLLVDEPTAHLDPQTAAQVIGALLEIAGGRTLIVATHDAQLAASMDRVIVLNGEAGAAWARPLDCEAV